MFRDIKDYFAKKKEIKQAEERAKEEKLQAKKKKEAKKRLFLIIYLYNQIILSVHSIRDILAYFHNDRKKNGSYCKNNSCNMPSVKHEGPSKINRGN